jgi:hypothetical protein
MGGSDNFVMLPALAIAIFPFARLVGDLTMSIGELSDFLFKKL